MAFMQKADTQLKKLPMCDLRLMREPQAVVEVVSHCLTNMLKTEAEHAASPNCIGTQHEIIERMR